MRMPALSSLTELNNKTSFGCPVRSEFQSLDQI